MRSVLPEEEGCESGNPANSCGRWSSTRESSRSSWFQQFLDFFLLPWRDSEAVEREENPVIIGGSPATISEAPWLAFVEYTIAGKSSWCTGFIIDQRHALTAAHSNYQQGYDIAVIKLANPLNFTPSIQPICIARSDNLNSATACYAKMFGWGSTTTDGKTYPTNLKKVDAVVLPRDSCSAEYNRGIICARGRTTGTGTCSGDSGGPLVVYVNGIAYAMGVDSYGGKPCLSLPSHYTRITSHVDFINSVVTT
ncbi:unnamed protein product, partial [Darwinula stevensoni]